MSWSMRLRILVRVTVGYLAGWRGLMIGAAAVISAAIVWAYTGSIGSGLVALAAVGIPLLVIGFLLANQDSRSENRIAGFVPSGDAYGSSPSGDWPPAEQIGLPVAPPSGDALSSPLVAVVVTTWNESRFIETTIKSIKAQEMASYECIVVDDASTDDTVDKLLALTADDPRFRVMQMVDNGGAAVARNVGLAEVTAPYVTYLDGDDFLYPNSLQTRLESIAKHEREPWVGGVFCRWSNVPEDAELGPAPEPGAMLPPATWLSSLADAPFVVSAPMMRVEVLRSVGGFPAVGTAEDALLWNRILREGYIFTPVNEVGVAYRMKRNSVFRRTAADLAALIADGFAQNAAPADNLDESSPFPFREPCTSYLWDVTKVRRLIGALAGAVEAGDEEETRLLAAAVSDSLQAYQIWELPLDDVIRNQATRVTRYASDAELVARRDRVVATVSQALEPRIRELLDGVRERSTRGPRVDRLGNVGTATSFVPVSRSHIAPELLDRPGSAIDGRVILMPSATYHVAETGPLADELADLGVDCVVMVSDYRWPLIERPQSAYQTPVLASVEAGPWLGRAAAIVVMNDWGEEFTEYVDVANDLGVPTFAKVEGVQDFEDDDVHWDRKAYQRARWILAQGQNDVAALPMKDTFVVSSNRLEKIWEQPPRVPGAPLAVINLNFTYGVLDDARDMWLDSVAVACKQAAIPYVISLHPAERDRYEGTHPVATVPIRHLMTVASVLITRFSTVPFEAIARGVPFIYHNPHGEKVPTFATPDGAFDITTTVAELVDALRATEEWQVGYRERAAEFFLNQIDVDPDNPSSRRAARVIANQLAVTP